MTEILTSDHKYVKVDNLDITIRPITLNDKAIEADFVHNLSPQAKHERFLGTIKDLSPSMLTHLCDIDYVNSMAYLATIIVNGSEKEIGVCRYANDAVEGEREMAIAVADEHQNKGIETLLIEQLIEQARASGIKKLVSIELSTNHIMKTLAKSLTMDSKPDPDDNRQTIYSITL
jgi:acetyltransferase